MNASSPVCVGRLAPSPTGALHLGNARTFLIAWLRVRAQGGKVILRIEDLDHPRDKPGAAQALLDDLLWLGLDWDEVYVQSARHAYYADALQRLIARGYAYACVCSRKDVEHAQSAPHAGEQLFYPGTCRDRFPTWQSAVDCLQGARLPCWRFRVPEALPPVAFQDAFAGPYVQDVRKVLGDFPLARDAQGAGYTLAVVVDDALMGVTEVVRGDDLLPATPAQILIQRALGFHTPVYCHVPLVIGADGKRLAKRHGDTRLAAFRASGVSAARLVGYLAFTCGWAGPNESLRPRDLVGRFSLDALPHEPLVWKESAFA